MFFSLGTTVRHYYAARRRRRVLGGESLRNFQDRRARQVIAHAVHHAPFYRDHLSGLDPARWREFPTIDKKLMMDNFDVFTTRGISKQAAMDLALEAERSRDFRPTLGDLTVGLSSGTSGHRGLFLVDKWEQAVWAGRILAWILPQTLPRSYRAALFLRSGSNLHDSVQSRLIDLRYYDLMTAIDHAVATLNEFQPDILVAPPSFLVMLAHERLAHRLRATPRKVVSVAEVLDAEDASVIRSAFGEPIHQVYQCTEGLIAATCRVGVLHVLEDGVALQYEPVEERDPTRVSPIVTDLWRTTQPIIRYRLNDILVLNREPCACACRFRRIERIEGRKDDIFHFHQEDGAVRLIFPDVIRRAVLLASDDIVDYEVVQDRVGSVRIHFVHRQKASYDAVAESLRRSVEQTLREYACTATSIEIEGRLPSRSRSEKRRRIRRMHS